MPKQMRGLPERVSVTRSGNWMAKKGELVEVGRGVGGEMSPGHFELESCWRGQVVRGWPEPAGRLSG